MSKQKKYSSLEKYYDDVVSQTIEECTLCGDCIRNCPLISLAPLKDKDPADIMEKMIDFLKGGDFSEEVYVKAFACNSCRSCSNSCPQGIDVLHAFAAARDKLVKQGKMPEGVNFVDAIPSMWRTVSALQVKPSERRWLEKVPSQPKRIENVVFLGCTLPAAPHTVFALLDVIERTGINFVTLAGGELCCGFPSFAAGKIKKLEENASQLVASLKAFSPKRVILPCAGCYRHFTELYPLFLDLDFEVQYYAQFLNENLEKMNFAKSFRKTAYFHASCMSRSTKANELLGKFLEDIPGLKVVKAQCTTCCGGTPKLAFPEIPAQLAPVYRESLAKEVIKTGADYLVNLCQLCDLTFSTSVGKYPFGVKDVPALINESMGGKEYKNKWLEYWRCQSDEEIIEKSRENIEANGLTEEEVRQVLPMILSWKT